jgi:hypothetical protein
LAVSPEPKLTIARSAPQGKALEAGRARVIRELLAETNGSYNTSELFLFGREYLVLSERFLPAKIFLGFEIP